MLNVEFKCWDECINRETENVSERFPEGDIFQEFLGIFFPKKGEIRPFVCQRKSLVKGMKE